MLVISHSTTLAKISKTTFSKALLQEEADVKASEAATRIKER